MCMLEERLTRQLYSFGNGFLANAASPLFYDGFPSRPAGNHLQDLPDHNARAAKGGLAVTH